MLDADHSVHDHAGPTFGDVAPEAAADAAAPDAPENAGLAPIAAEVPDAPAPPLEEPVPAGDATTAGIVAGDPVAGDAATPATAAPTVAAGAGDGAAAAGGNGPRIIGMDPAVAERKRLAAEAWQRVLDARGTPTRLEGTVKRTIPGGLAVEIDGVAGFVPASQIRLAPGAEPASLVGTRQPFVVLETDEARRRAVVSHRRAVDGMARQERAALVASLTVGAVRSVKVVRIVPFGAFVEIGPGIDGLVPIGELAPERVGKTEDVVAIGDVFDATIIRVEDRGKKIALSRKAALPDPWRDAGDVVRVGRTVTGTVVGKDPRLAVELAPNVVGTVREADADPADYALGEAIEVVIRSADRRTRKIGLALPHAIVARPSSSGFAPLGEELARRR